MLKFYLNHKKYPRDAYTAREMRVRQLGTPKNATKTSVWSTLKLQDGSTFPCRGYFFQQPSRTKWLANHLPDMLELETYWKKMEGGSTEPARTLKSDILAEWEAISRTAKVHWAEAGGSLYSMTGW